MCVTVTTYSEHPCGAVIFSGRSNVGTFFLSFERRPILSGLKSICRLIVAELPAREVIVTLDNILMRLALRHANNRMYEIVRGDL